MNILHAVNCLSRRAGGVAPVVWGMADAQSRSGHRVAAYAIADPCDAEDWPAWRHAGIDAQSFARSGPRSLGWSRSLHRALLDPARGGAAEIVHQHGIWSLLSHSVHAWQRAYPGRAVVAPHGMLDDWAVAYRPWRKRVFGRLVERDNMGRSACLHAVCESEIDGIRSYGLSNPIAVVPNGVRLADYKDMPARQVMEDSFPVLADRKRALFLSRVHPKKGLRVLLEAWSLLHRDHEDWVLVITGPDQVGHEAELRRLCVERELGDSVLFTGPLYGEAKRVALAGADVFVLPSFSEGLGVAVLEAMACSLPVLVTPACHLPDVEAKGAGLVRRPERDALAEGLRNLLGLEDRELARMGAAGRVWVEADFASSVTSGLMTVVYEWLLGGGTAPSCVVEQG